MGTTDLTSTGQRGRLIILLIYVVGLLFVSWASVGSVIPPTGERGIWFYSALAALLLGSLLVTPYFTKPVDAIAYSVAALVPLLAVNVWGSDTATGFDRFTWTISILYVVLALGSAILAISLKDSTHGATQRIGRSSYLVADLMGTPRAIFSVLFLFALITYHRGSAREYVSIGVAWALFVAFRPLERVVELIRRLRGVWASRANPVRLGEVVGHEVPGIVLIREDPASSAAFGDLVVVRTERGTPGAAIALDHVGFADGCWLRAFHLRGHHVDGMTLDVPGINQAVAAGSAYRPGDDGISGGAVVEAQDARKRLLGLVAPDTTVARLRIELVRGDLDVRLGSLVEVAIGKQTVLYQIIDGLTKEEILQQKNSRGYVYAHAKTIGAWDSIKGSFDPVQWLPRPNEAVLLARHTERQPARDEVGRFLGTSYPVRIDPHLLVTHNTAVLGILGVGKTFLAIELVERMIAGCIKVICLDLTDQYSKELAPYYNAAAEEQSINDLNAVGPAGKSNVQRNVEQGGSVQAFTSKMKEQLTAFLDPARDGKLRILNPARFEVWRQDSKQYPDGNAAMATLTPCEVTRIISEAALEVLQAQGMTDKARCCIVYEEAHSLIPEWNAVASEGDKTATNGTAKAILQGRKFGLGCLVITQRTANVTKSILNQCNTVFALRVFDATGMEFLKNYIGEDYAGVLSTLDDRHAVVFGRASSCRDPVLIRLNDRSDFVRVFRQQPVGGDSKGRQA